MTTAAIALALTTEEFHAAVHALAPAVAVFDCDGTLWAPDSGSGFMAYTIETGLLSREAVDRLNGRYDLYRRGELSELAICGEMVQVYQGLRESTLRAAARAFFEQRIAPSIFREMRALVAALRANGTDIWAVSSTNDWVVEEGVSRFGIPPERVLSARVRVADGLITRDLLDVPTDQGKVDALARIGLTSPDAVFGNSVHDAAMLAIARGTFSVNPSPALAERSAAEGWPVYYPALVRNKAAR